MAEPSATDFLTIAEDLPVGRQEVSKERFWDGLSRWLKKRMQKTAMLVEKSSQAQRLKQFFARPPAHEPGYGRICSYYILLFAVLSFTTLVQSSSCWDQRRK